MPSGVTYYPIQLDLRGQKALVIGGGRVALRKIETLLYHGAFVSLVAREMEPVLRGYVEAGRVSYLGEVYGEDHLDGAFLVIAATDDAALNRRVSDAARSRGLLVNAVDQPSDCNFIVPSILRRGDLTIAVSTAGKSPALAKRIRQDLEAAFGPEYETFLILMGRLRDLILTRGRGGEENHRLFHGLVHSPLLQSIREGQWNRAAETVSDLLDEHFSGEDIQRLAASGDYAGQEGRG